MGTFASRFRRLGRRFAKDERGAIAVFLAAGIVVLVGVVGLGVDTIRGYLVQSRLSAALDAAGLAGGRVMFSANRDNEIRMYFAANFPPGYMGSTITGPAPVITTDAGNSVLTLSVSADVGTTFMKVLGFDTMAVASSSQVTRQTNYLEVMLAIDVSGSMSGSRISAARTAAKSLTQILYDAAATPGSLQIGLVPWNGKVNVGTNGVAFDAGATPLPTTVPSYTNPLTGNIETEIHYANNSVVPLLDPPPANWRGCVFQRFTNDADNTNDADLLIGGITVGGADWPAWEPVKTNNPGAGEPISGSAKCDLEAFGNECTQCPSQAITDMTTNQTVIDDAIDDLATGGFTNAVQGLVWAWQVLMPTPPFTSAFTALPPNTTRKRAIILLTDGEQTGRSGDGYKAVFGNSTNAQGTMLLPPSTTTDNKMNQRLLDLSANIKAQGVLIYTVQFANTSGTLRKLLENVSTGPTSPFYNTAASQQALDDVFKEIANDLAELHVSM